MNRTEIVTSLVSGGHYTLDQAFDMADQIITKQMERMHKQPISTFNTDPTEVLIKERLNWVADIEQWRWKQASLILKECGIPNPDMGHARTASIVIRSYNGDQHKRSGGKNLLLVPPVNQ